jgi:hypothetical protein
LTASYIGGYSAVWPTNCSLLTSLVITIALAAVSFWALVAIRKESLTDLQNTLEVEAVNLGLEIDNDLELDSPKARKRIQSAVDRRATRLGVAIVVVDKDGASWLTHQNRDR